MEYEGQADTGLAPAYAPSFAPSYCLHIHDPGVPNENASNLNSFVRQPYRISALTFVCFVGLFVFLLFVFVSRR